MATVAFPNLFQKWRTKFQSFVWEAMKLREIQEQLLSSSSLPKSSIIQRHFSATLGSKFYAKINSIPFLWKYINLQL